MLTAVFWCSLGMIAYPYAIFPALVVLRGLLRRRPFRCGEYAGRVTLIIAAHNEAPSIGAKLDNICSLAPLRTPLEVIVASDGSTDGTQEIARGYAESGFVLLDLPRAGKARALNAAVAAARGEILAFTDANSMLGPQALPALLAPFADPAVGGVAGDQRYLKRSSGGLSGAGEKSYWSLDRLLKVFQSRAGSATSATGALYAIRREHFTEVAEGVTDDFFISTGVVARGRRLVFAPDAVAVEPVASTSSREFGRKVRVITRGLYGVLVRRELLNPFRHGFYALQLLSHKVLRRLVVFPLLALAAAAPLLWGQGPVYQAATLSQGLVYGLALAGLLLSRTRFGRGRIFSLPFFFCLVNAACLVAVWQLVRGRRVVVWEPRH